jgi:hypothetical protein
VTDEQEEDFRRIGSMVRDYVVVDGVTYAILSGSYGGMTFVGRWIRDIHLKDKLPWIDLQQENNGPL